MEGKDMTNDNIGRKMIMGQMTAIPAVGRFVLSVLSNHEMGRSTLLCSGEDLEDPLGSRSRIVTTTTTGTMGLYSSTQYMWREGVKGC